jgi:predicted S18 family serine protease
MYRYRYSKREEYISKLGILLSYGLVFVLGFLFGYQNVPVQTPLKNQTQTFTQLPVTYNFSSNAPVLAVMSMNGSGVMGRVNIEIRPGKGRVLMNTNPFLEPDTQYSAEIAVKVAQEYTKKDLSDKDVIISFDIGGELLGGPSAGAAMSVATISAIEGRKLKEDVAITGTITESGEIGMVGGIIEKAEAAAKNGIKLFLVPEDALYLTYYEKQVKEERIGRGFIIQRINYIPKRLDLNNYTKSQFDMETKGVSTIQDVVRYMLE